MSSSFACNARAQYHHTTVFNVICLVQLVVYIMGYGG